MASFKVSLSIVAFMALAAMFSHVSLAQNSPDDFVKAHNKGRAEVGVPPLKWNKTVEAYAVAYAEKRSGDCALEHSMGPLYGENIAGGGGEMSGVDAVNMWVGEKSLYIPRTNACAHQDDCLHYTEVVWRKVTDLGCARVQCSNGGVFIICNYWPMGNIEGQRAY